MALFTGLFLLCSTVARAEIPEPFYWEYDITYQHKKKVYKGSGYYRLVLSGEESAFTLGFKSKNKLIRSREWVVFSPDEELVAIPRYRKKRTTYLGIPVRKKIKISPPDTGVYYDGMTVVLRMLHDIEYTKGGIREWSFYHADDQKIYNFTLIGEEKVSLPLGEIDCYVVRKKEKRPDRSLKMWVAKSGYYIAAMENRNKKDLLRIEIESLVKTDDSAK